MTEWLASIPLDCRHLAAGLRSLPDLEAAFTADAVWLRGHLNDEAVPADMHRHLKKIPHVKIFILQNGQLRPENRELYYGSKPQLEWMNIRLAFTVELPPSVLPAQSAGKTVELELAPSSTERHANLLILDQTHWLAYAQSCPEVRLAPLKFSHDPTAGRIMVRGTPLPPLPGTYHHEEGGVAVPCGVCWQPPVDAATVRRLAVASSGDLVLFDADGSFTLVPANCFLPATRSGARLTIGPASGEEDHV